MQRWLAVGALVGIAFGIFLYYLSPGILYQEFLFNRMFRQETVLPEYSTNSGSLFTVGILIPTVTGIIGALFGSILHKITNRSSK